MKHSIWFALLAIITLSCNKQPTCSDGILNGSEIKIDCGGSCDVCPSCFDGIQNQDEVAIDCGGVCTACPAQWEEISLGTSNRLKDIAFFEDGLTGLIIGENGSLHRTTDAGDSWTKINQSSENLNSIYIQNGIAYISGRSLILIGRNKGASWQQKSAPNNNWNDLWFFDEQNGVMVGDSLWAIRTVNGGDTWISELRDFFDPTPLGSVSFLSDQGGSAGAESRLFITSNGGKSWNMASTNADSIGGMGPISNVVMVNANRTILAADRGMFVSTNNLIWLNKGYEAKAGKLDFRESDWLYACANRAGDRGLIYYSSDGGVSWERENLPFDAPAQNAVAFIDDNRAISVGNNGSAYLRIKEVP